MWEVYIAACSVRGVLRLYVGIADDESGGVDSRLNDHKTGRAARGAAWLREPGTDAGSPLVRRATWLRALLRHPRWPTKREALREEARVFFLLFTGRLPARFQAVVDNSGGPTKC